MLWLLWPIQAAYNESFTVTLHILWVIQMLFISGSSIASKQCWVFMVHLSPFFFFLSHFGSLNYNAYFFVAIIIIIIYVIIIIVIIAFKCTTIFTQGTCQPPTTNAFWHHFWVWNKFAGPISMSWNRVSLRLNSVKNKYGVDIHNYVHYPQHILWLFDGWANLPSTTSVTNMIISSKLEYTSCFTSCPTTWDLRS